jgi:hypothetical protein
MFGRGLMPPAAELKLAERGKVERICGKAQCR